MPEPAPGAGSPKAVSPPPEFTIPVGVTDPPTNGAPVQNQLEHLHQIIEHTPSPICIKDSEHRFVFVNAAIGEMLGVDPSELIGTKLSACLPPAVADTVGAAADRAQAERRTVREEVELADADGKRTLSMVTFPLTDQYGQADQTCTICTDVTAARRELELVRERDEATELVRGALQDRRMLVYAQPIVDIRGGVPVKEELLVRLQTGDGTVVAPSGFLPAAERFDLIQEVDTWMVSQALELARDRTVSVNISPLTMCDAAARENILSQLAAAPGPASEVVFELTETAAAQHIKEAVRFAAAITELGCGLALDDFGTGFGTFTYLRRLPIRHLKIDRSFVSEIRDSGDDRRVVKSIVSIAEEFELRTIAEGVEDEDTLALLANLGVDYAQGYLPGRPAPAEAKS